MSVSDVAHASIPGNYPVTALRPARTSMIDRQAKLQKIMLDLSFPLHYIS
jgi:hypothetical protein